MTQEVQADKESAAKANVTSWRWWLLLLALLALVGLAAARLIELHLYQQEFLQRQGDSRTLRTTPLPASRGMIVDRHGEPLAISTPVQSLWANPQVLIQHPERIPELAQALLQSPAKLREKLQRTSSKAFIYLRRQLNPAEAEAVLALKVPGVYAKKEYRRFYPAGEIAAQVVGFTNIDDQGQEGMELAYNHWLSGQPGSTRMMKDLLGRPLKIVGQPQAPKPGNDLRLTLDMRLQYMAYRELKSAVTQHGAQAASLVMLSAQTGEVLAMVNQPSFNPNDRSSLNPQGLRNRAVIDLFEPGSTIKPLTIAAALEQGVVSPHSLIDTHPGHLRVNGQTIRDLRNHGVIDVATVMRKSSNVGIGKIVLSMPQGTLGEMFYAAGIGKSSALGFPGEASGRLLLDRKRSAIDLVTMSYGYGISMTAVQLAQMYLPFANAGVMPTPGLVHRTDADKQQYRLMSAGVADQVLDMLEAVVQQTGGTGQRAQVPFYRVAGKTGTVHKVGQAGYIDDQYLALFAGVAPVSEPKIVMVVLLDSPQGREYYGGEVAAPVFSRVAQGALRILNVTPDALPRDYNPLVMPKKPGKKNTPAIAQRLAAVGYKVGLQREYQAPHKKNSSP